MTSTQEPSTRLRVAVFGCEADEAAVFHRSADQHGVTVEAIAEPLSAATAWHATGSRCISIDHRTEVANSTLCLLRDAGVEYVSTRSAGRNHLDEDFARSIGITVEGVAYSPGSVADYTLMLMLMAIRGARTTVARAEQHDFRLGETRSRELGDMTVGVIGTGRIGSAVIDRLRGFGSRVLAHDRSPKTTAEHACLDEVLAESDIVTLHTPLTAETRHLIDARRIALMRPGAVLVNTGRGGLVDTEALIAGLESGHLGGAALDVLEDEEFFYSDNRDAPIENETFRRLHRLPNVLVTPHTAYYTHRALTDTVENTLINCLTFERRHHG